MNQPTAPCVFSEPDKPRVETDFDGTTAELAAQWQAVEMFKQSLNSISAEDSSCLSPAAA